MTSGGDTIAAGLPGFDSIHARQAWLDLCRRYDTVVLVANSDRVRIEDLQAAYGGATLFVFFNKVFKVLSGPFDGDAVLVARSGRHGANIVKRGEVDTVVGFFPVAGFKGILNLRAGRQERFSTPAEFGLKPDIVAHLDISEHFAAFYPGDKVPSSGFALATWLERHLPDARVVLAGFSAQRSEQWKLFDVHAWTFEQIILDLLVGSGRLVRDVQGERNQFAGIRSAYPEFSDAQVQMAATEVLTWRLDSTNDSVDSLYSATRPLRALRMQAERMQSLLRRVRGRHRS